MKKFAIAAVTAVIVTASFASIAEARRSSVVNICVAKKKLIYPKHGGVRVRAFFECSLKRFN